MLDIFDGSADLRRYNRNPFSPHPCEFLAFESYGSYTLARLMFEGRGVLLFIVRSKISVETTPNGSFAHFISTGASLVFSAGGLTYISDSRAVRAQDTPEQPACFAGFDKSGRLRLVPNGALAAVESGIIHGAEASPFLIANNKRLTIKDDTKRSRDRLLLSRLRTGEPAFIYIKSVEVARAADYAFQLGCSHAAVIANERHIDIYGKGIIQDRQAGCSAAFVIRQD